MRPIDADEFKQQVAAQAFTNTIPVEKANMLCQLIDGQPTIQKLSVDDRLLNDMLKEIQEFIDCKDSIEFKDIKQIIEYYISAYY